MFILHVIKLFLLLLSGVVSDLAEWLGYRLRDVLYPIVLRAGHHARDGWE
jgi:hypothetical protein